MRLLLGASKDPGIKNQFYAATIIASAYIALSADNRATPLIHTRSFENAALEKNVKMSCCNSAYFTKKAKFSNECMFTV